MEHPRHPHEHEPDGPQEDARQHDQAALDRLVELGLSPNEAEAVIEAERATGAQEDSEPLQTLSLEQARHDLQDLLGLREQPDSAGALANLAADLRRGAQGLGVMPSSEAAVASYQSLGLDRRDALTVAGFEYFLRYKLAVANDPAATLGIETGEQPPRHQPRVYVATPAKDEQDTTRGGWVDAAQSSEALAADITTTLNSDSPSSTANDWAVTDVDGFANLELAGLSDIDVIGTLGRGVAEHGAAFVAWATLHGTDNRELLARFTDFYVGSYRNELEWVEDMVIDLHWVELLDRVVDPAIRPYLKIDLGKIARSARTSWDVVTGPDGRVYVFLR